MADVFVSYSRTDKARVAPLVAALEAQGWSVWWDPAIAPGQQFDRLIAEELERARAVIVVWTADSVESRWVRGEAREGADRGILVPVQLGPVRLPIDFRAYHTTDLGQAIDVAGSPQFQELVRAIEALAGRAPRARATRATPGRRPTPGPRPGRPRIAICVLPFANLSGDPEQQYFSDGITADIITELSRWRLLAVRSRSASFKYRGAGGRHRAGRARAERTLRRRGQVRRIGDRVRISVQLIDAESGRQRLGRAVRPRAGRDLHRPGRGRADDRQHARRPRAVVRRRARAPQAAGEPRRLRVRAERQCPALGRSGRRGRGHAAVREGDRNRSRLRHGATHCSRRCGPASGARILATRRRCWMRLTRSAKRAVELDDGESTCHSLLAQVCLQRRAFEMAVAAHAAGRGDQSDQPVEPGGHGARPHLRRPGRGGARLVCARAGRSIPTSILPWYWRQTGQTYMTLGRYQEAVSMFAHIPIHTYRTAALMAGCHARLGDMESARRCARGLPGHDAEPSRSGGTCRRNRTRTRPTPSGWPSPCAWPACPTDDAGEPEQDRIPGDTMSVEQPRATQPSRPGSATCCISGSRNSAPSTGSQERRTRRAIRDAVPGAARADRGRATVEGAATPRALLAAVVVLDQFSRNMFRGTPRAFAADPIARRLARQAIDAGTRRRPDGRRAALSLPALRAQRGSRGPGARGATDRAARQRRLDAVRAGAPGDIIERFGRFPHRNAILGRTSTAEELELLESPMGSF